MNGGGQFDELAATLVVPAQCGFYITKSEIIMLANLEDGSLRVNERKRMLADVLKSPDTLAGLEAVLRRLLALCELHAERYAGLAAAFPAMAAAVAPSLSRVAATQRRLVDLCEDLQEEGEG
ncbi:MAG: hypothetical protein KC502_13120 [Myxococcales bacterium]|nr:hypothetical protein [Myxococcales bacterium]